MINTTDITPQAKSTQDIFNELTSIIKNYDPELQNLIQVLINDRVITAQQAQI